MKLLLFGFVFLGTSVVFGATNIECLNGNFSACREVFSKYGSKSERVGAVDLFEKACSSQSLKVNCQVISCSKAETLKKTLEMAKSDASSFVINGAKIDKIYQIAEVK